MHYFFNSWFHGITIQKWIACKKIPLQKPIEFNSTWLWRRAQLAINKKQEYFSLPDHLLTENLILITVCKKEQKEEKSKFATNSVGIIVTILHVKTSVKLLVKPLQQYFITDHLNHKIANKKTCRTCSANPRQLSAQLKSFRNLAIIFWSLQAFLIYLAKYFWSLLNSPNLITQQCFAIAI